MIEACEDGKKKGKRSIFAEKFIGAFILVEKETENPHPNTVFEVVDGQQRITTLSLIIAAGVKVLLEIVHEIAKLSKEAESTDPELHKKAEFLIGFIVPQIKETITMLYDPEERTYAPKLFRERDDLPEKDEYCKLDETVWDNEEQVEKQIEKQAGESEEEDEEKEILPKKCEIFRTSDDEVEACYKSPTARFFFYLAKARAYLRDWDHVLREYEDALSAVCDGEKYLNSSGRNKCYKLNYELAQKFLKQLSGGMKYSCESSDLPFNKGLGEESQYEPKSMPDNVQHCVAPDSKLRPLMEAYRQVFSSKEDWSDNSLEKLTAAALYVLSYLDFLSQRVSIAVISGKKETALDIFETMNTAGQPLGCIETFIPEVYQTVGKLAKLMGGVNKTHLLNRKNTFGIHEDRSLEDVIQEIQKTFGINKNRAGVPQVIVWFSLICFGKKLGKNFSIQRAELAKNFKAFIGSDHGNFALGSKATWQKIFEFVSLLSFVGKWWVLCYGEAHKKGSGQNVSIPHRFEGNWAFSNGFLPKSLQNDVDASDVDVLNCCLLFLIRAGQSLSVAVIGRYYVQLLGDPSVDNFRELVKAAKTVAAFTAIWLSGEKGSTQYAETQRRTMVHKVEKKQIKQVPGKLSYFWKESGSSGEKVTAEQLQKSFISGYEAKNGAPFSLHTWTDKLPVSELADLRKEVNRFLLLLYWHCSTSQDCYDSFGIRKYADKSVNFLTGEKWNVLSTLEVEHIVPQEPKDWELDFDPKSTQGWGILNEIGNTTLLPKNLNVYASNRPWDYKRRLYEIVCVTTDGDRNRIINELDGIPEKERAPITTQLSKLYLDFKEVDTVLVASVRHVEHWSKSVIQTRTKAIAHIVWPLLSKWMGRPEKFDEEALEALFVKAVPTTTSASASASITTVPTPAPKEKRGRRPKTVAEATATSNTTSDDVHESLRPFFDVIPRDAWTKVEDTKLTFDSATSYLSVRVEEDKTIVEIGRRGQGRRLRSEKTLPPSVKFEKIPGADRKCVGEVYVFSGTGPEAEKKLVGLVNKRKDRFVEK